MSYIQSALLNKIYLDLECDEDDLHSFNIINNIDLLILLIKNNNNSVYVEPEYITDSSGFVIVFIFKHFVIKIYKRQQTLSQVVDITDSSNKSVYMVSLLNYIDKSVDMYNIDNINDTSFYAITTNRLDPFIKNTCTKAVLKYDLFSCDLSIMKLIVEIGDALYSMYNIGYSHNDCTLDNIGLFENKCTLFDFNISSKTSGSHKRDILNLINSIQFNINQNSENTINITITRILNYLNSITNIIHDVLDLIHYISEYYNEYYSIGQDILDDLQVFEILSKYKLVKL